MFRIMLMYKMVNSVDAVHKNISKVLCSRMEPDLESNLGPVKSGPMAPGSDPVLPC